MATVVAVVALVAGTAVATVAFLDERGTTGLTSELAHRSGSQLALRAAFDRADDAEQQDAAVRAAIDRTFAPTGVRMAAIRSLESDVLLGVPDETGDVVTASGTASTFPDFDAHARFETGAAPEDDHEVAVQADAAALLGLALDDEVLIVDVPFTVSGTWRASDPLDPRWYGDDRVVTGGDERLGPFAVDESAWSRIDQVPLATWTIVPATIDELPATDLVAVTTAWGGAQKAWRGTVPQYESMAIEQRLSRTLVDFAARLAGLRAIEPVAFVLITGSTLVALAQIIQLLVTSRARESALHWARGQSPAGVARRLTVEVGFSALLGALLGGGVVVAVLLASGRAATVEGLRSIAWIVPAIVVGGATITAAVIAGRSAREISTPSRGGRGGGAVRRVAVPGIVVLVSIAAALSVWQLRLYGSPVIPNASGYAGVDPIAVAAPALALIALVLIGLAVFPTVVALIERRARQRGVRSHLTARTLLVESRRVVAPLVVVALAVGSATVAATFSATWSTSFDRAAELYTGADLRVSSRFTPLSASRVDAVAATDGVTAVAPLAVQSLTVGAITGATVAVAPEAVRELASTAGGTFSPGDAASAIDLHHPGPAVPEGTRELTLRVEALRFVVAPALEAWILDPLGRLHAISFAAPTTAPDDVLVYTADPGGLTGTLVALDVHLESQSLEDPPSFRLVGLAATTDAGDQTLELDQFWLPDSLSAQLPSPTPLGDGSGFALESPLLTVRLTASFDGTSSDEIRPRMLVSEGLARDLELGVGDLVVFGVRESDRRLNGLVVGIVPAIPGARTDQAALIDLAVVTHLLLRSERTPTAVSDLWVSTDDPARVQSAVRAVLPADTVLDSSTDPVGREVLGAAPIALGIAALCCLVIAIIAVASAARSRLRWGREDIATLRALGLGAKDQAAIVAREQGIVLAAAGIIGVVAGTGVSLLTVPELVRAAVDRASWSGDPALLVPWLGLAAVLGALALGVGLVTLDQSRRVRHLASTSLPGEAHE